MATKQDQPDGLNTFRIEIELTPKGVNLHSLSGSAWTDLSITLDNDQPQAIDEYGMTELNAVWLKKDPTLTDFLFTITKSDDHIILKGITGTAWTDLSLTLENKDKKVIDQHGLLICKPR